MNPMQSPNTGVGGKDHGNREPRGFICSVPVYEFEGWIFEYHPAIVWPLKKNGEPRKRAGAKFYEMVERFCDLPKSAQKLHRIGGGCQTF